jgi:PAS domain S-box-containing protein
MEKAQLLANLVEQTSDILLATDLDYKPITWNKGAEEIYGFKREAVIGRSLNDFLVFDYALTTQAQVRKQVAETGEWSGEASFVRPTDLKKVTVLLSFKLIRNKEVPFGILVTGTEITLRKETELKLRESEKRFRELADAAPVMVWMSDHDNNLTYYNTQWLQFTGADIRALPMNDWTNFVHEEDLRKAKKVYDLAFKAKKEITLHYRLKHRSGQYRWIQDVSVPRFLHDGTFIGYIGTITDIEEQKKTEEQLKYQARILENVSDIVVSTDLNFIIRVWNKAAEQYYRIQAAEAIGRRMRDVVQFAIGGSSVDEARNHLLQNGSWQGEVAVTNDGSIQYLLQSVKYVYDEANDSIGFLAIGRDITEKKQIEQQLLQSEQFYRTLIADSLDGLILMDGSGTVSFCSPSSRHVLGFDPSEVVGRNGFEFVHPDDRTWAFQSFQKELQEEPEIKFITIRLLHKSGEWVWCMVRGHNLLDNPNINSIVVYFHDDRLRKEAADALKESEKRFRTLVKDLQIGVLLQDANGRILFSNNAMHRMFDVQEAVLAGQQIWKVYSDVICENGFSLKEADRPVCTAIRTKKLVADKVLGVWHPQKKERIWLLVSADPILDEAGNIQQVVCSFADISERKKLEYRLITDQINHQKQITQASIDGQEKERLEIGKELHDNIGQQLTTIKLFLDLGKETADESTCEMINMALKGVADVINEIRAMSRALVPHTLNDLGLVDSLAELVESSSRSQLVPVHFDAENFEESFLPANQKLTIFRIVQEQLNNIAKYAQAKNISIILQNPVQSTLLEISDDGVGFDQNTVRKGLGFINIRNRAELFGGRADIISAPGSGCILKVQLPPVAT